MGGTVGAVEGLAASGHAAVGSTIRHVLDNLVSRQASDLYERLVGGEYHVLEPAPATLDKLGDEGRELVAAGLARVEPGDPPLLVPIAPALVAQTMLSQLAGRIATWQDEAASSVRQLIELQRNGITVDGHPVQQLAEVVTDPSQVMSLVDGIQLGARRELLSLDTTAAAGSVCQPRVSPAVDSPPPVWRTVYTSDFTVPERSWIIDATVAKGGAVRVAATLLPTSAHQGLSHDVYETLLDALPAGWYCYFTLGVIAAGDYLIPDLIVLDQELPRSDQRWGIVPGRLVVEVEPVNTERLDRFVKPDLYARQGFDTYWRVEKSGKTHVYTEPQPDGFWDRMVSVAPGETLKVTVPFEVELSPSDWL